MFEGPRALDNHQRIQISEEIYIEYDPGDTWVMVADENWHEYDQPGGVIITITEIDRLVEELLKCRGELLPSERQPPEKEYI